MVGSKEPIKKALSAVRLAFTSQLGLAELTTEGSLTTHGVLHAAQAYNPGLHEACPHVPVTVNYSWTGEDHTIANIERLAEITRQVQADRYMIGEPKLVFPSEFLHEDEFTADFPVSFYRRRRR